MVKRICRLVILFFLFHLTAAFAVADQRTNIYRLAEELEKQSFFIAQSSFNHFKGRNDSISDLEQEALFKSEAFLASCRLFLRLTEEGSGYFSAGFVRTNLYSAFVYLTRAFQDFEESMRNAGVMPYALSDCRNLLGSMEREFSRWPSADNLAYLHQKYVKASDDTVFMIERKDVGVYVRHAFTDLESLFRYNYDQKRGKDPWKYLVEVSPETLEKMEDAEMIGLTFEGCLVIEQSSRPMRSVYLIENGKKRGVTSPRVLQRLGGWDRVFEVPVEIITKYPDGDPII